MSVVILNLDYQESEYNTFLKNYGIGEYKPHVEGALITQFYKRVVESNVLVDGGVNYTVLREDSIRKGYHNLLKNMGILSFLRVDNGHLEAGIPKTIDHEAKFKFAKDNGLVGIKIVGYVDNIDGMDMLINNFINYAYRARKENLLPIFEINVRKEFKDKDEREKKLFNMMFEKMHTVLFSSIHSYSLPETPGTFDDMDRFDIVKLVMGNDFEQTLDSYVSNLKGNTTMNISVRDVVFNNLKVGLDQNKFNTTLLNNLKSLQV